MRPRAGTSSPGGHPDGSPREGGLSGVMPLLARIVKALCSEPRLTETVATAALEETCHGGSRKRVDRVALVRTVRAVHASVVNQDRPDSHGSTDDSGGRPHPGLERDPRAPLRAALGALPPISRLAVQLVDVEAFSYREAAAALELPVDEFPRHLHAARLVLLPALGEGPRPPGSQSTLRR